jgi:uncharacterized coiled-coil protein SlyX
MADLFLYHCLRGISRKLKRLTERIEVMSTQMDRLTDEVSKNTSVIQSALVLIRGFKAQLEAAQADPVKLSALADQIQASEQELATAVAENTPAAPPPTP